MQVGDRIVMLRESENLTQQELAQKLGISRSALSHYEKNRRAPDYETLVKIAKYFHVTTDYLLANVTKEEIEIDGYKMIILRWIKEGRTPEQIIEDDKLLNDFKKKIRKHLNR